MTATVFLQCSSLTLIWTHGHSLACQLVIVWSPAISTFKLRRHLFPACFKCFHWIRFTNDMWMHLIALKSTLDLMMSRLLTVCLSVTATWNAWLVVFVLPINSALNPVIYTIAAPTELHHRIYKSYCRMAGSLKRSFFLQSSLSFLMEKSKLETRNDLSFSLNDASDLNNSSNSRNSRRTCITDISL